MKHYNFNIKIPALLESEAEKKMQALTTLASKLTVNELAKLAHIVATDPVKTAMAKSYLGVS